MLCYFSWIFETLPLEKYSNFLLELSDPSMGESYLNILSIIQ